MAEVDDARTYFGRQPLRIVFACVVALMVMVGMVAAMAVPARADEGDRVTYISSIPTTDNTITLFQLSDGSVAYCLDRTKNGPQAGQPHTQVPASQYRGNNSDWQRNSAVRERVFWVLRHGYPALNLSQLAQQVGLPSISQNDAIIGTQYAIWAVGNPTWNSQVRYPLPGGSYQLYTWLMNNVKAEGVTYDGSVTIERGASFSNDAAKMGPYVIKLTNMTSVTLTATNGTVVNAAGAPVTTAKNGDEVYLIPSGTGQVSLKAKGSVMVSNGLIWLGDLPRNGAASQELSVIPKFEERSFTISDFPQSSNPVIGTSAVDKSDGDRSLATGGGIITDTVYYDGLTPGKQYTLNGELMVKATGQSTGIKATKTFTPTSSSGSTTLDFTVGGSFAGQALVVFETLSLNGSAVAEHKDITDTAQTVHVATAPVISTSASDQADGDKTLSSGGGIIVDIVTFSGLDTTKTYVLTGVLMDKATGQSTGITTSKSFKPATSSGTTALAFTVPGTLAGKTLVAFESLSADGSTVAEHKDINDAAQTVSVEKASARIGTTATDKADGDKTIASTNGTITDTVAYEGLEGGASYSLTAELFFKSGAPVMDDGRAVTQYKTFTAAESGQGTTTIDIPVPASAAGQDVVVFETVRPADKPAVKTAEHRDLNDAAQTVTVEDRDPATVKTSAVDKSTGTRMLGSQGGSILDTVTFTGLVPGKQYTLEGDLMDKATGKAIGITSNKLFTPSSANGTVTLEFWVPAGYAGKDLVVFEAIMDGSNVVAEHTDINDAKQTVHVDTVVAKPTIGTTATDAADGDKLLNAAGGTIKDAVAYTGLTAGTKYTLEGELMDKATGESTGIKNSKEFTPDKSSGTVNITFDVPGEYAGKSLVVFETLKLNGTVVADHKDITDPAQTVGVNKEPTPSIDTNATDADGEDGDKVLGPEGGTVRDTVTYTGLKPGTEYTLSGELMDKATGKGTGIKNSKKFTPTAADGTETLDFTVPAGFAGKSLVVFEVLRTESSIVAEHKDIDDDDQTVGVDPKEPQDPTLATSATDAGDGDKSLAAGGGSILDTVTYTGLKPGTEYLLEGELMDKATSKSTGIKNSTKFTPQNSSGTVELTFTVPAGYAGKSLVVFESVLDGETTVVDHQDINSEDQTVPVEPEDPKPSINTNATDAADGDKVLGPEGGTVRDAVKYTGLKPGTEYRLEGELMDKATGKGTGIKADKKFTPTKANGTETLDFTVPAGFAGKSLVVFEVLKTDSLIVAEHKDIGSTDQTVHVDPKDPTLATSATDAEDGDKTIKATGGTIKDTVTYTGLEAGKEYTLDGELMDKATSKSTGIKNSTKFTPKDSSGTVELTFTVPASMAGKALVVFESVLDGETTVVDHQDINSENQTVTVRTEPNAPPKPTVTTAAKDKSDGDQNLASGGGTITDVVSYTGLTPGTEYTVEGVLMDKATGKSTGITASAKFKPAAASGSVELDFRVPAGYAGKALVVFETIKDGDTVVAEHKDINAASQTVTVDKLGPTVSTLAKDKADGDKSLSAGGGTLTDIVTYTGLKPGTTYTVQGELMDKATGKSVAITSSRTFTPAAASGSVELDFTIPAGHAGKNLVVFETIYEGTTVVAEHKDINAASQTVTIEPKPTVDTRAKDKSDGDQSLASGGGTITDIVSYTGLKPGTKYTVQGELMDKGTGKTTGIVSSATFTPTSAAGSVELDFTVPAGHAGKSLVVFEAIYEGNTLVAEHKDINAATQTVKVEQASQVVLSATRVLANTGAQVTGLAMGALMLLGAGSTLVVIRRRKAAQR